MAKRKEMPEDVRKEFLYLMDEAGAVMYRIPIMILNNQLFAFTKEGNHGIDLCPKCAEALKALFQYCALENQKE